MDITFGFNVDPRVGPAAELAGLARTAERSGFDLIGIQDHPYQPGFYDTWSLITYLAAKTERIAFTPNVANLGLRPPAMLAKAAASVSSLLGGRIQLGVGAGASGGAIPSMGGADRTGKHMLHYVRESLTVMRRALDGGVVRLDGNEVDVRGYQAGPVPPERIELWVGAIGPAMLANVGRYADGWMSPGSAYLPPSKVPAMRSVIDESAEAAGRDPSQVRRIYNIFGGVGTRSGRGFEGPVEQWAEWITSWTRDLGFTSFVFWPVAGDPVRQAEVFGNEVIPAVRVLR
ncbi:LLM class flavin-dependent oxidoreductase [Actinoplanes sp. TBRC 11911]|uniref:LLM class flavin-dependent oxidoreductase n=1 Tax=Actinoplanes sp. TBRC 11911 TaxID=2729386 RepID=UPI00145F27B3|nr:LLM class flavin-dependent oxidoreductase [Actinoplanes sp. TBRC 11911]NMO55880.1 LLM class flavin-dependent oxidoreductase [Actinoplanes sp. TBRC 11911]